MKRIRKIILIILAICFTIGIAVLGLNFYIKSSTKGQIISVEEAKEMEDVDCVLVLGCGVYPDGTPSPMLHDRLDLAAEIYKIDDKKIYNRKKILLSGDHGTQEYNEVRAMKDYLTDNNLAVSFDIFMDHAGFSTYDSIYRAKEIFGAKKIIIVTNTYHLYRALYIAKSLGIEAYGVGADDTYSGKEYRECREILARDKDFAKCLFKPEPKYLGEKIDITGNGNETDDLYIKFANIIDPEGGSFLYGYNPNPAKVDLNGDGSPEWCTTASSGSGFPSVYVIIVDMKNEREYHLLDKDEKNLKGVIHHQILEVSDGKLVVERTEWRDGEEHNPEKGTVCYKDGDMIFVLDEE